MIIFFLASIILFILAIVSFVSALLKKKSKKTALVFVISAVICFFVSFMLSPAEPTTEVTSDSNSSETGDLSDDSTAGDNDTEKQTSEENYKVGDTIKVSTNDGSYTFSITGITETADRNEFSDIQADRVVIIDYAYENIDVPEELYLSEFNFKAYDADNNALETYPANIKYADSVSAGRKTTGQMAFALNNPTNKIELEYFDNMFSSSKDCLIVVEW